MAIKNAVKKHRVPEPFGHIIQINFPFLPANVLNEILEICARGNDPEDKGQEWPCDKWCPMFSYCNKLYCERMENSDDDPAIRKYFERWLRN